MDGVQLLYDKLFLSLERNSFIFTENKSIKGSPQISDEISHKTQRYTNSSVTAIILTTCVKLGGRVDHSG